MPLRKHNLKPHPEKPTLHMPTETLAPNKYADAYLIGLQLGVSRSSISPRGEVEGVKLFTYGGDTYCCPLVKLKPPKAYNWVKLGTKHSRHIYRVTK